MASIMDEVKRVVKGGTWNDQDINEPTTWQGETGSSAAVADETATHVPQTHEQIRDQQLEKVGIDTEILNAIVAKTQAAILKGSGMDHGTIIQLIDNQISTHHQAHQQKLDAFSARIAEMESMLTDKNSDEISRLDERVNLIERKQDALIGDLTSTGPEQAKMIKEAYEVIKNRQARDEETISDPSIIDRLKNRATGLEEHLRKIEPFADQALANVAEQYTAVAKAKKKFGKMI